MKEVPMQTRKAAVFSLFVLALAACATPAPQVDTAADEQAVRALSMKWLELDRAKDHAGIAALFADDGVVYRGGEEPAVGAAAIQAAMAQEDARNPNEAVDWTTDKVEISSAGDIAIEQGSWSATGSGPAGNQQDRGRFLTVWRKVNGEWKVVADMSVSTVAPAAAATTGM
jgi:uncharacterized protein (TIGR02246 family)